MNIVMTIVAALFVLGLLAAIQQLLGGNKKPKKLIKEQPKDKDMNDSVYLDYCSGIPEIDERIKNRHRTIGWGHLKLSACYLSRTTSMFHICDINLEALRQGHDAVGPPIVSFSANAIEGVELESSTKQRTGGAVGGALAGAMIAGPLGALGGGFLGGGTSKKHYLTIGIKDKGKIRMALFTGLPQDLMKAKMMLEKEDKSVSNEGLKRDQLTQDQWYVVGS